MKTCKTCKHYRPDHNYAFFWLPIIGWLFVLFWHTTGKHHEYAKCGAVAPSWAYGELGYCSTHRGALANDKETCGASGSMYEARK